jgi:hypothetical protein
MLYIGIWQLKIICTYKALGFIKFKEGPIQFYMCTVSTKKEGRKKIQPCKIKFLVEAGGKAAQNCFSSQLLYDTLPTVKIN